MKLQHPPAVAAPWHGGEPDHAPRPRPRPGDRADGAHRLPGDGAQPRVHGDGLLPHQQDTVPPALIQSQQRLFHCCVSKFLLLCEYEL